MQVPRILLDKLRCNSLWNILLRQGVFLEMFPDLEVNHDLVQTKGTSQVDRLSIIEL